MSIGLNLGIAYASISLAFEEGRKESEARFISGKGGREHAELRSGKRDTDEIRKRKEKRRRTFSSMTMLMLVVVNANHGTAYV